MSAVLAPVPDDLADPGAPVTAVTGLPGAGKTLYALSQFAVGKQQVYQAGIPGCALPEWDPTKWMDLPAGSTLIVDEAQEVFPPRNPNADPPAHYVLNRVRHKGIYLVFLTQHPNMLDSRVRRLVGRHYHLVNVFGAQEAMVHEYPTGIGDVDNRSESKPTKWRYPREVYKLYKSSDMHRSKGTPPRRVLMIKWLLVAAVVLTLAGLAWTWQQMGGAMGLDGPKQQHASRSDQPRASAQPEQGRRVLTPAEYVAQHQPRVEGLAYSAPRYDDLTKPTRAPYPAACVSTPTRCKCYSQDATALDVPDATCRSVVERGFFKDWSDPTDKGKPFGPAGQGQTQPGGPAKGNVGSRDELVALADQTPPVGQAVADGAVIRSMRK